MFNHQTYDQPSRLETLWQDFLKRNNAEFEKAEGREDCVYMEQDDY